jgi:serine protease
VAAAGNEGSETIPYPARAKDVIAVGATTEHGCLANYSNYGPGITLVAPGGGPDAELAGDPGCRPDLPAGKDIFQETFTGTSPRIFGFPGGYEGTSMATPHVSATAALIIASGMLGPNPTPAELRARIVDTARKLGSPLDESDYGAGLLDAAAATASGGPGLIAGIHRANRSSQSVRRKSKARTPTRRKSKRVHDRRRRHSGHRRARRHAKKA